MESNFCLATQSEIPRNLLRGSSIHDAAISILALLCVYIIVIYIIPLHILTLQCEGYVIWLIF